ncbi:MAG: DUF4105 domain-containing protein [Candidatus Saccharibacteria bacterium]|nr:DUF4105 domain-containing protein [Moraxellaceae bacterium]
MLKFISASFCSFSVLLFCLPNTYAQDFSALQIKQEAHELHLAEQPVWQKIILFRDHAEVTSKDFYLSDSKAIHLKQITPQLELDASIDALHDNPSLICKYPARYYWLSQHVSGMPTTALKNCKNLPNVKQDVRMLLVSGYLKNPVSTFGHVLITVGEENERQNLLDSAYNFGAIIPENENSLSYIANGFSGNYDSRFANSKFFKQDIVYAKNEQRDIWAYTLNLTPEQKALFIYHLTEVESHTFDYYFIKQNCAYRSGELLELISDIKTTQHITPWYAPEYIFDQIEEYRKVHPEFIKSVEYLPSDQNKLYFLFSKMPQAMQQEINYYIETKDLERIEQLPESDQEKIFEFLIAYLNYKNIGNDKPQSKAQNQAQKKVLIQKRIQLPINDHEPEMMPIRPSSALGEKPSRLGIGLSNDQANLNFTVFNKDMLSSYSNIHSEFKMLDFSWQIKDQKLKLQSADFIKILKIENLGQQLTGERKMSWELAMGAKPDAFTGQLHHPYLRAGLGAGYDFSPSLMGYSMLSAELNDSAAKIDAVSETGLVYQQEPFGLKLTQHFQRRKNEELASETRFELKYRLAKNVDLRMLLSQNNKSITYQYFW